MRFLADENIEKAVVDALRAAGHDVVAASEERPTLDDERILEWANREGRILVTNDKDFGDLVFRQKQTTAGVLLVRVGEESAVRKAEIVRAAVRQVGGRLKRRFAVVSESGIRMRKLLR